MASERKRDTVSLAPVRVVPGEAVSPYEADVVERVYALWAGKGALTAAAAVRYYEQEVAPGTPVPTPQSVNAWVRKYGWMERFRAELERDNGQTLYEMQARDVLNYKQAGEEMAKVVAGVYDENPMAGALRIKAREQLSREIERKVKAVLPQVDKSVARAFNELSLEEQEAAMRDAIQKDKA